MESSENTSKSSAKTQQIQWKYRREKAAMVSRRSVYRMMDDVAQASDDELQIEPTDTAGLESIGRCEQLSGLQLI